MQFSPRNSPAPTKAIVASFPFAEVTVTLSLALLHVKNRVGRVALRVGHLILFQTENFSAQPSSREKGLGDRKPYRHFLVAAWAFEAGKALQFRLWRVLRIAPNQPHGTRLAGRPWLRAGMPLALISYLRGAASHLALYIFRKARDMHWLCNIVQVYCV